MVRRTDRPTMTISVDLGRLSNKTNKQEQNTHSAHIRSNADIALDVINKFNRAVDR